MSSGTNQPTTYPLIFIPHSPLVNINYIRHQVKEWDINKMKDPIYFYQPTVTPTRDGGFVKEIAYRNRRRNNKEFVEVRKEFIKKPDEEPWFLYTNDGIVFKGTPDTLSKSNFAVLVNDNNNKFTIQLVDQSIRVKEEKIIDGDIDIDAVLKQQKRESDRRAQLIQKRYKFIHDDLDKKEKQRKLAAMELEDVGGEDAVGSDGGDDHGDNEGGADVVDQKSDDDGLDPGDMFDDISSASEGEVDISDDENEEEDENDKKSKKAKGADTPAGEAPPAPLDTSQIVIEIFGEEVIKEDEVVRYMRDVGAATAKQLMGKFKSKLKTEEQKKAFKMIVVKRLQTYKLSDVTHYKLKTTKK